MDFMKTIWFRIIVAVVIIVGFLFLLNPIAIIDPTERGLKVTFGTLSENVLKPGITFRNPFADEIKTISMLPRQYDFVIEVGKDGALTKDNQTIGLATTTFFKYNEARLLEMYRDVGEERMLKIIETSVKESVKTVLGKYSIMEISEIQRQIQIESLALLREMVALYPVEITELKLLNYDWDDRFDTAIQETQQRAQEVNKAKQDYEIARTEAQKQVAVAQAVADAAKVEAEGKAAAQIAQAQGEATASKLRAEAKRVEGEALRAYNLALASNWNIEREKLQLEINKIRAQLWNGMEVPEQQVILPNGFAVAPATR